MHHIKRVRAENRQEMHANSVALCRTSRVQRFLLRQWIQNVCVDSDAIPKDHTG